MKDRAPAGVMSSIRLLTPSPRRAAVRLRSGSMSLARGSTKRLLAATRIFEVFLPWHLWLPHALYQVLQDAVTATGITLWSGSEHLAPEVATTNSVISIASMLAFVALYSTTGGLRGVVATDVLQFTFRIAGTAAYAFLALRAAGGRSTLLDTLEEQYGAARAAEMVSFVPPPGEALLPFLTIIGLQWFFQMNADGTGYLAQRTMACRTDRDARTAAVVFTFAQIVLRSLIWLPIVIALIDLGMVGHLSPRMQERRPTFAKRDDIAVGLDGDDFAVAPHVGASRDE